MDAAAFYTATLLAGLAAPFLMCALLLPLERAFPRRPGAAGVAARWGVNMPLAAAGAAAGYAASAWAGAALGGLGARFSPFSLAALDIPAVAKVALGLLAIDFLGYGMHVLSHKSGLLWRFHKVHHSDDEFDASTGLRHQPLEGLIGFAAVTPLLGFLGIPFAVIAVYGVLFAVHSAVSHANVALPPQIDRWLRLFIVTPDMHRLHHSANAAEYDSNYGQIFPYWDMILCTLKHKPAPMLAEMPLGLTDGAAAAKMNALQLTLWPLANSNTFAAFPPPAPDQARPSRSARRARRRRR